MKRILVVLAVVMLVVALLPGLLGGAPAAIADFETPVPGEPAAVGTPDLADASASASDVAPLITAPDMTAPADVALIDRLQTAAGPSRVATHLQTGRARFFGADVANPGFRGVATGIENEPDAAARAFLTEYGSLFGIVDVASLQVMKQKTDTLAGGPARAFVRYQQTIHGIPVLGGELVVQVDETGVVWSASGEALPEKAAQGLAVAPSISAAQAAGLALGVTAKHEGFAVDGLRASAPELWYYAPELLGQPAGPGAELVWRVEVTPVELGPVRELVLIDAQTGKVALNFNQIAHGKNRVIYDNQNNAGAGLPGFGPVRTEGQGPTGQSDADLAYDYAGDTYDFFLSRHGRDSIDGAGLPLISTVRYCSPSPGVDCPYENAFWNGAQMVYGATYAAGDDVVAHELTHGVTDYESQLFYFMQSGALNESLSDIWGEYVDQTNGKGNDSAGVKWQMGEDLPIGAIRNMANPGAFGDPDRVGSGNYWCSLQDNGGVHINSGVPNKAAYLMTDGGSFNGKTVSALGIEKTARIWYRMATLTLVSGSEFQDAYDLLPQACMDLAGGGVAGITPADCQEVRDALDATQMNAQPASCASTEAPVCAANQIANTVYNENFENHNLTFSRWASAAAVGPNPWYFPQTLNPYGEDDLHYATSGLWHLWGDSLAQVNDGWMEMTQGVTVPSSGSPYMRFRHSYSFEYDSAGYYDGGVLEYSANGGAWTDAAALFTHNGYDGVINSPFTPYNPLKGRQGFRATSWGYQSTRLNLNSFKGQNLRFRFRVGADGDFAFWGWFIDDVMVYTCVAAPTPTPSPTNTPNTPWIAFASSALPPASFNPARPVRIQYGSVSSATTATGTLTGAAVFDDGSTSQNKPVPAGAGQIVFNVKAKPGSAIGAAYTLQVKMGSQTISKSGKVAREIRLPLLLR